MSDCHEAELISAYIDNELADTDISTLEQHCDDCRSCREDIRDLREAKSVTAGAVPVRAPADLIHSLLAQIDAARLTASERRRTRFPLWAGGLAAAASLVVWIGLRGSAAPAAIPIETLIAAHHRPAGATLHDELRAAAVYSALLKRSYGHERS